MKFKGVLKFGCIIQAILLIGGFSVTLAQDAQKIEVTERDAEGKALRVSANLMNFELKKFLEFLGKETNLTIIAIEEEIKDQKFSLTNLEDVTVEKMLEEMNTVFMQFGLTTIRRNNTLLITTIEKAGRMNVPLRPILTNVADYEKVMKSTDEVVTQPIILNNTIASEVTHIIKPLLSKTAIILTDSNSNALIITDVASNIYKAAAILKTIDTSPYETGMKLKIIPILNSDARSIAQTLTEVFREETGMYRGIREASRVRNFKRLSEMYEQARNMGITLDILVGRVQIVVHQDSNSLIVRTSEENMALIEILVQQLDHIYSIQPSIKIFRLKAANAENVARELDDLIHGGGTSQRMSRWERRDWQRRLWENRMRLKERGITAGQTGIIGDVNIVSDQRLNAIIVSTAPDNLPIIEKIINELDQAEPQEEFGLFFIKNANAEQMVATLQDIFEGENRGRLGRRNWENRLRRRRERIEWGGQNFGIVGEVNLVHDERLNAILVTTAAVNMPVVKSLIERLDITMPGQEWATKIYPLEHTDAATIAGTINEVYQGGSQNIGRLLFSRPGNEAAGSLVGNVKADPYPLLNALIISTSRAKNWELIEDFVKSLDVETPEEQREITKIIMLEYADAQQIQQLLSQVWYAPSMGFGIGIGIGTRYGYAYYSAYGNIVSTDVNSLKGRVKVYADERTNSLVITTNQRHWRDVEKLIKQLDVIRGQVWLDIDILELSLDETTKLGVELSGTARLWKSDNDDDDKDSLTGSFDANLQLEQDITGFSYTLMTKEYMALISTLMKENKVKVLSSLSIVTRDNKAVAFNRGKKIPYLESVETTGGQPLYNYDFIENVGVNINITPHIAKTQESEEVKRTIGLDITQVKSSNFIEFTDFHVPITDDSTISVYVDVEDEQPIVIGGMTKTDKQKTEHKIPILGDIPFVGRLFKKTETVNKYSELIIIITPHIIDIQSDEDKIRLEELQEERLGQRGE